MPWCRKPLSRTWGLSWTITWELVSIDFFTVPTAMFQVLFVLVLLTASNNRRRVLRFSVMEKPTASWTAHQMVEASPEDTGYCAGNLPRHRDKIHGQDLPRRIKGMGIKAVPIEISARRKMPWSNTGRLDRRERLDHVVVLEEKHAWRILKR